MLAPRFCASLAVTALIVLATAAGATAATPAAGTFSGHLSTQPVNGFRAPVHFAVVRSGTSTSVRSFTYGTLGCEGAGGFRPGATPYTGHSLVDLRKDLAVSQSGRFSARNVRTTYTSVGAVKLTVTTTSSVMGRFTKVGAATGTIHFSQHFVEGGHKPFGCTGEPVTFAVTR